jgi:hypothetical protein
MIETILINWESCEANKVLTWDHVVVVTDV